MNNYNQIKNFNLMQIQNFISDLLINNTLPHKTVCDNQIRCAGCGFVQKCVSEFLMSEAKEVNENDR